MLMPSLNKNDTQPNGIQPNNTLYNKLNWYDVIHSIFIVFLSHSAVSHFSTVMTNVVMLNVIALNAVMLKIEMLTVITSNGNDDKKRHTTKCHNVTNHFA